MNTTNEYLNYLKGQAKNIVDANGFCHACEQTGKHETWCVVPRLAKVGLYARNYSDEFDEFVVRSASSLEEMAETLSSSDYLSSRLDNLEFFIEPFPFEFNNYKTRAELRLLLKTKDRARKIKTAERERDEKIKRLDAMKQYYSPWGYQKLMDEVHEQFERDVSLIKELEGNK